MHFFTNELGGNAMMYVNLIWIWGHPEVYILILPASARSPRSSTFSGKPLFGYKSMVYATSVDHRAVLSRVAAPLLHDGLGRLTSMRSSASRR
jgi:heme/copper-type cytochrome/quinol oxidase subunit 1